VKTAAWPESTPTLRWEAAEVRFQSHRADKNFRNRVLLVTRVRQNKKELNAMRFSKKRTCTRGNEQ
jgi:hypothetical protein